MHLFMTVCNQHQHHHRQPDSTAYSSSGQRSAFQLTFNTVNMDNVICCSPPCLWNKQFGAVYFPMPAERSTHGVRGWFHSQTKTMESKCLTSQDVSSQSTFDAVGHRSETSETVPEISLCPTLTFSFVSNKQFKHDPSRKRSRTH